jgi:[ribosomal protein S5]-alanine N-acetyltransferase
VIAVISLSRPTRETERLILRPFTLDDAPRVQTLAGDGDIASTTLNIPHPYEDGMAEQWIGGHQEKFEKGTETVFALTLRSDGLLIGAMGLVINSPDENAELGYWIGKPYWNNGYATEAAKAVLDYAFNQLNLHRVHARHLKRNPTSGRVMQKIGLKHEGCQRQHTKKWDVFEDIECYGILRADFAASRSR